MSFIKYDLGNHRIRSSRGSSTQGTHQAFHIDALLELEIDTDKLRQLKAHSALLSKSGKTTLVDGAIVIRVKPGTRKETDIVDPPKGSH